MLWIEAAITEVGPGHTGGLVMKEETLAGFSRLVESVREAARKSQRRDVVFILQLRCLPETVSTEQNPDSITDNDIGRLRDGLIAKSILAARAGFDGVSLKACRGDLPELLLTAKEREGRYGGAFENRCRFIREALDGIRTAETNLITALRLNAFHARASGFGVDRADWRKAYLSEPAMLARDLRQDGLDLLSITAGHPNLLGDKAERLTHPFQDFEIGDEHPLNTLSRNLSISRALRAAAPGLTVVTGGFTWLRHFMLAAAAAALRVESADIIGLARPALAYPDLPRDLIETGAPDSERSCILCQACLEMADSGAQAGCVVHDRTVYAPRYRFSRRFAFDRLLAEAARCHACSPAPCTAAIPGRIDIPLLIRLFAADRIDSAFEGICRANLLPETSMALAPTRYAGEDDCVERAFSGRAVAIRDIMLETCRIARERGLTAARLSAQRSECRQVAVVGGGVAGIAAAAQLLKHGHRVTLFERKRLLGGVPEILIPGSRFSGAAAEIDALLGPAIECGRINVKLNSEFGAGNLTLDSLRSSFDAVLIAAGLWQERRLGQFGAVTVAGVTDALSFLETGKAGRTPLCLESVAILAGGDCAMDSAAVARESGASRIYIVFPGPRSEMHWCMEETFFTEPGVHALMLTRPVKYIADSAGKLAALRVIPQVMAQDGSPRDAPGGDYDIPITAAVEARGLETESALRDALHGVALMEDGRIATRSPGVFLTHTDRVYACGAVVNGGASVPQCAVEGMMAADEIDAALGPTSCPSSPSW